jgi:hypothetical protein
VSNWFCRPFKEHGQLHQLLLTVQGVLGVCDLSIGLRYTVVNFLIDCGLQFVKALLGTLKLRAVVLAHGSQLAFELLSEDSEFVLELSSESLQCIIYTFLFGLCEVSVSLNFALDVLELSLELLFALNTLHEHHIVVSVHLNELVVHLL